eukprot:8371701-Karenia_brevis.AAC.2
MLRNRLEHAQRHLLRAGRRQCGRTMTAHLAVALAFAWTRTLLGLAWRDCAARRREGHDAFPWR